MTKKYFITFGNEGNFSEAAERLTTQAKVLNVFDNVICYKESDLQKDSEFWEKHCDFIKIHKKGYGYYLWKPYLILKTLNLMEDNDVLVYLDAGCEINTNNINKKNKMISFFDIVQETNIIYTLVPNQPNLEKYWNKMDLIDELEMNSDNFMNSPQIQAGVLMLKKCEQINTLIQKWYELCCNYHFLDDSKSLKQNYEGIQAHRHDQSIISLLIKKYGLENNLYSLFDAIEYVRNRSGKFIYPI